MKQNSTILKLSALPVAVAPTVTAMAQTQKAADDRPNIVVIVADDLLTSELSCYGGRNLITPNIDRLAAEGVKFTNNYASMSMSVPIRASMYTGLYPIRHGSYQNHKPTFDGTKTVNEYMAEEGYRVGRTGKGHPNTPSVYKFEEIPGFTRNCVAAKAPYHVNGIREFINRNDQPFLLYVCSIHPHVPWTWGDPGEFDANSLILPDNCVDNPRTRAIFTHYLAEVRALDNEVGSVLEVLSESGKLDNTIVMFLGEQGPQIPGGKWTCWYPGVHSALVARYPAKIEAGRISNAIVQYEDLLPTFIDIAGGEARKELDGISFKDALFGDAERARDYAYGLHNNIPVGNPYPIRYIRDERYALIWNLTPDVPYHEKHYMGNPPAPMWASWEDKALQDPQAKMLVDRFVFRPEFEFYDLQKDPWELRNLAGKAKYKTKIEEMKRHLEAWMKQQGDKGAAMDIPFQATDYSAPSLQSQGK